MKIVKSIRRYLRQRRRNKRPLAARIIDQVIEAGDGFRDGRKARGNQYHFVKAFFPSLSIDRLWMITDKIRALSKLERVDQVIEAAAELRLILSAYMKQSEPRRLFAA